MVSRLVLVLTIVAAVLQVWLLWVSEIPLGVVGEWTWPRIPYSPQHLFGWLSCGITGTVFLLVVWLGGLRIEKAKRTESAAWLLTLCCVSFLWVANVISINPDPAGLGRTPFVLYYPRSSGYFWQARYEVTDLREFFRTYQDEISIEGDPDNYLHIGTHPPGLTAACYGMRQVLLASPALERLILATEPSAVEEAFSIIETNALQSGRQFDSVDRACLWLSGLIVLCCIALVSMPLYLSVTYSTGNRLWAWMIASLWPLVPGASIFFPKSDLIFPLIAMTAQYLWLIALDRKSFLSGAASALVLIGGMLLSLALLPVAAMFGLQTLLHVFRKGPNPVIPVVGAFVAVALSVVLISSSGEMNLLGIWLQNVRNHAAFYDHSTRTYLSWLWVNPLELVFSMGGVLAVLLIGKVAENRKSLEWNHRAWSVLAVWSLLWLSGKNMGEAARLWCFLIPLVMWAGACLGAPQGDRSGKGDSSRADQQFRLLLVIVVLQMVVCVLTASRVDGFHLAEL